MTYFHPEDKFQFGVLYGYDDEHPGTRYLIESPNGESYICRYFLDYRDWPALIKDVDKGIVVYPGPTN